MAATRCRVSEAFPARVPEAFPAEFRRGKYLGKPQRVSKGRASRKSETELISATHVGIFFHTTDF